jgi:hypothetical protein
MDISGCRIIRGGKARRGGGNDRLRLALADLARGDIKRRRNEKADQKNQTKSGQNHNSPRYQFRKSSA